MTSQILFALWHGHSSFIRNNAAIKEKKECPSYVGTSRCSSSIIYNKAKDGIKVAAEKATGPRSVSVALEHSL